MVVLLFRCTVDPIVYVPGLYSMTVFFGAAARARLVAAPASPEPSALAPKACTSSTCDAPVVAASAEGATAAPIASTPAATAVTASFRLSTRDPSVEESASG